MSPLPSIAADRANPSTAVPGSIGVIAVGRATFDLAWGRRRSEAAVAALRAHGVEVVGDVEPVTDPAGVADVVARWHHVPDLVVVLQATFTDSRFATALAAATSAPLAIWSFPERRGGDRLRSNSLCGLILASFALAELGRPLRWLYVDPPAADTDTNTDTDADADAHARIGAWLARPAPSRPAMRAPEPPSGRTVDRDTARATVARLSAARIGVVGEPPPGFDPCTVDASADALPGLGTRVSRSGLAGLLQRARGRADVPASGDGPAGIEALDPSAVASSFRLRRELQQLAAESACDALAVRCWPEPFDELGCAACAAFARLNETGVPVSCEADALGAATMLVLSWLGDSRPFLADLVDVDRATDSAALWHCGVAPADLAAPGTLRAGVHPNRGVPLAQHLALRPGRATVARFSRSRGALRLVVGAVEVLDAPCPYVGSGGTVRFGRPVGDVLDTIVDEGLDHHLGLVYGDVTAPLRAVAAELAIPVVEL